MNINELLKIGRKILIKNEIEYPIQICRTVLSRLINKSKEYLIIHSEEKLDRQIVKKYFNEINKIAEGFPLQYITQNQEFMKLNFFVNESVLIPRQDTEILVEEVLSILEKKKNCKVLDLCTGSGAIGISIAKYYPEGKITISDISKDALYVAKKNAVEHNVILEIVESDLFKDIKDNKFDVIVSNPPYIETEIINSLDKQVRHEPLLALDGGDDGLNIYRRIINEAYKYLNKDGYLAMEIGYNQKEKIVNLLQNSTKYKNIYSKQDLSKNDRIVICQII